MSQPIQGLTRRRQGLTHYLALLAGGRADLIDHYPSDRKPFVALGIMLLATMVEAMISGGFAVSQAFTEMDPVNGSVHSRVPGLGVVLFALIWGLIILTIDRLMVIDLDYRVRGLRAIVLVAFRAILAVVLGFVMATPLVIAVFQSDIASQITIIKNEQVVALKAQQRQYKTAYLDPAEASMRTNQTRLDSLNAQLTPDPASDPTYLEATANAARLEAACEQTRVNQSSSESYSSAHVSRICRRASQASTEAAAALARAEANPQVPTGLTDKIATQTGLLESAKDHYEQANSTYLAMTANITSATEKPAFGLLTAMQGLNRLTDGYIDDDGNQVPGNRQAWIGHWGIVLLLVIIELLPVLVAGVKAAQRKPGDYTEYEKAIIDLDGAEFGRQTQRSNDSVQAEAIISGLQVAYAEDIRAKQQQFGHEINHEIFLTQLALGHVSLSNWRAEQARRFQISPSQLDQAIEIERLRWTPNEVTT